MRDLAKDLSINPDELDIELLHQPEMISYWAKEKAKLQQEVDHRKNALEVIRAELGKAIRSKPGKYGLDKVSEKAIEETIITQAGYQRAAKELIDTQHDLEIARAAVTAIEHRKDALENLVRLFLSQYFSGPTSVEKLTDRLARADARMTRADEKMTRLMDAKKRRR